MPRHSGRVSGALRAVTFDVGFTKHAEGSVLVSFGDTRVLCTASVEERVPQHVKGTGRGWITAEYGMLPRATNTRSDREAARGKQTGRTMEIQRLIGRALRAAVDLATIGERTITLDCDVIQADGGTRTASITGAWVALCLALRKLVASGALKREPTIMPIAAVSVGISGGTPVLDLDYLEDSTAQVDMNIVGNGKGDFVEIQGTAETGLFSKEQMDALLGLAQEGLRQLVAAQRAALERKP